MDDVSKRLYIKSIIADVSSDADIIEKLLWEVYGKDETVYINCVYQIIGYILNNIQLDELTRLIKNNELGWNHNSYDDEKHKIRDQDDFIEHPFEVEEGVLECRCGSKRVYSFSKQTRSADEPMTTYAECVKCNSKWTYSG